ncbi:MAG: response regulator [Deltaproteobacteria bacterium]|nr:response regulator [Deltaproteobacteria bacterium]MBW1954268.1 response regulator [Deltaproteobacteria bacterium]MBW2042408.1 response regulator [Deltaproteobacteria bacterium]MBW2131051.1 response regulator [Deltaproteobacteria bacterium]
MEDARILKGKRILVVDDEPDILETLIDLLDMCIVETAQDFETGEKNLRRGAYDAVILDIMGVDGYKLLEVANEMDIPAIMLTAHALSPDNLVKSIKEGAFAYLPKDKMVDITDYLADLFNARQKGKKDGAWFARLRPLFDEKFGPGWRKTDEAFWKDFDRKMIPSREELNQML